VLPLDRLRIKTVLILKLAAREHKPLIDNIIDFNVPRRGSALCIKEADAPLPRMCRARCRLASFRVLDMLKSFGLVWIPGGDGPA